MHFLSRPFFLVVIIGLLLGIGFLLLAPFSSQWGIYHPPHERPHRWQELKVGQTLFQTFRFEYGRIDGVAFFIEPAAGIPKEGVLQLRLVTTAYTQESTVAVGDIYPDGTVFFPFESPVRFSAGQEGEYQLDLIGAKSPVQFKFQSDGSLYPDGEIRHSARLAQGDLAFQVHYKKPALASGFRQIGYAILLLIGGTVMMWGSRERLWSQGFSKKEWQWAAVIGVLVALWYGCMFLRPGIWLGPGDFVKDVSYLQAGSLAFLSGHWPVWAQAICGGLPLLANPESNVLSMGTIFSFFLSPDKALWLMLAVEAGIGAAGMFLLARSLSLSYVGSVLAAVVGTLGGAYAYRIVEGFSMMGGAMALGPWVLLGAFQVWRDRGKGWALIAGGALVAMFWRGEVHVLTGYLIVLVCVGVVIAIQRRSWQPIISLLVMFATFFIGGSAKLLPYLEQATFFATSYRPYVTPLLTQGLLGDVFWKVYSRMYEVVVVGGKYHEEWGNFGAYVGLLASGLTVLGLWKPKKYWWWVLAGFLLTLIIGEGALFAATFAHVPIISGLLRLPSRLFLITLVLGGLLAGRGLDAMKRWIPGYGSWVAWVLVGFLVLDLLSAQLFIFQEQLGRRIPSPSWAAPVSMLAWQKNAGLDDTAHAQSLLAQGYSLPTLCADITSSPDFIPDRAPASGTLALSILPSHLSANTIVFPEVQGPAVIPLLERFSSNWTSSVGIVREDVQGEIVLLVPAGTYKDVRLNYNDPLWLVEVWLIVFFVFLEVGVVYLYSKR